MLVDVATSLRVRQQSCHLSVSANPFPQGVEKLSGAEHSYRIRLGDYRVVYNVFREWKLVEIQRVRHRKDVYSN